MAKNELQTQDATTALQPKSGQGWLPLGMGGATGSSSGASSASASSPLLFGSVSCKCFRLYLNQKPQYIAKIAMAALVTDSS